ncbi:hypothetical protein [Candidatus Electronema sp. JM]|uniref:hypothetical protein n=1 Tax=Candidatus Electronema sp. JM TaxID=3401571 RepID=UPI003AA8C7F3
MNNLDKVRVLLPHWIEHNQGHGAEFLQWAETLAADAPEITALLRSAADSLHAAEHALQEAMQKAGGPLAAPGHCHAHGGGCHHHH